MPYTINKFNNEPLVVLDDGTIDTTTSLGLVGRNYVGYGETQNENFIWLLENFASAAAPSRPLPGQTWFNTDNSILHIYDGTKWAIVGSALLAVTPPADPSPGALWLSTDDNKLYVWLGTSWGFIGPEAVGGFGTTRARSGPLTDSDATIHPVIFLTINDTVLGIIADATFTIDPSTPVIGFSNIRPGLNMSTAVTVNGSLTGNATTATSLQTPRTINGTVFDGTANITVRANTTNTLTRGTYLIGNNFDGSSATTWEVDASSANQAGKVVARNAFGGFSAGTITADLTGNVTSTSGTSTFDVIQANEFIGATLSGNAKTASKFITPRKINGVNFDGSVDITITANSETLSGEYLNPGVTLSQLTQVGDLTNLNVVGPIVTGIGDNSVSIGYDSTGGPANEGAFVKSNSSVMNMGSGGTTQIAENVLSGPIMRFWSAAKSLAEGGPQIPSIAAAGNGNLQNLGHISAPWNTIFATNLVGNADTATLATTATNIAGGGPGSIPYQTATGTTAFLAPGTPGYVLRATAENGISWSAFALERLTAGDYILYSGAASDYDTQAPLTISVDATATNTVSKVVVRDSSGNFAAGTITASLTGNATTATTLQTARLINGVSFNGSTDITVPAIDNTKVAIAGSTMTGYLTLVGTPTAANHATTKSYVDSRLPQYTIISSASYSIAGFTNQVGSFNDSRNYFDVYPPSGKTMANLVAFIPSIHVIHFAGGVDGNDSIRCTYSYLGDRIRVYVQGTEQRSTPAANYLVIWS